MDRLSPPLAPAPRTTIHPTSWPSTLIAKRQLTAVACERCRRRKSKCNGRRPSCAACTQARARCCYEAGKDESRYTALKRSNQILRTEKSELHDFLRSLRSRSDSEAREIFRRLRSEADSSSVLTLIKDGDLLLQASSTQPHDRWGLSDRLASSDDLEHRKINVPTPMDTLALAPSGVDINEDGPDAGSTVSLTLKRKYDKLQSGVDQSVELYHYLHSMPEAEVARAVRQIRLCDNPYSALDFIRNGDPVYQQLLTNPKIEANHARLRSLDEAALRQSRIQIPARPWTNIAGDGIVSHLISIFFDRDQPFWGPFVNEQAFVADMVSGDANKAKSCSPLLVNAICACSAFTSDYGKRIDVIRRESIRLRFYDEARRLLESECGRASSANAQALLMLFVYSSASAMDRVGLVFRFAAFEMFKRLGLGDELSDPKHLQDIMKKNRKNRAQASWGLFLSESLCAFVYLQPSLIQVPKIPRYFIERKNETDRSATYPVSPEEVLDRHSDISVIFYRIATHHANPNGDLGDKEDLKARQSYYEEILQWESTLPPQALYEPHRKFLHSFMKAFFHFAVIFNFRPLIGFDVEPLGDGCLPAGLCLDHCLGILKQIKTLEQLRPSELETGSLTTLYFLYIVVLTLLPMLDTESASQEPFTDSCRMLFQFAIYWPAAATILRGLKALSHQFGVSLPQDSLVCFSNAIDQTADEDVPISWAVPQYSNVLRLLSDDGMDTTKMGMDLGTIIKKWNALTIQS